MTEKPILTEAKSNILVRQFGDLFLVNSKGDWKKKMNEFANLAAQAGYDKHKENIKETVANIDNIVESARKEGAINLIEEVLEISLLPHQIEWLYKKREAIKKEVK